jgi:Tfp pilus assembly protein PilF
MTSAFKFTLATLVVLPLVSACVTPQTKQVESLSPENKLFSDVQFTLNKQFKEKEIKCITVGNLQITDENAGYPKLPKERLVRQAIIGNLAAKNYKAILLEELNKASFKVSSSQSVSAPQKCDTLIDGEISAFRNDSLLTYSDTLVGLSLQMKDSSGNILWSGRHSASSKGGALPFSPFSLISGLIASQYNSENEVAFQMVDAVSRRLVDTIPDGQHLNLDWGSIENAVYNLEQQEPAKAKDGQAGTAAKLLAQGKIQKALSAARDAIQQKDSLYENYSVGAKAASMLQQHDLSTEFYLEAVAIRQTTQSLTGLSFSYLKSGRADMARASMSKAVLSSPEDLDTRLQYGLLLEAIKAPEDASKAYYQAGELAYQDGDLESLYKALVSLRRLQKFGDASQFYNVLIKKSKSLIGN